MAVMMVPASIRPPGRVPRHSHAEWCGLKSALTGLAESSMLGEATSYNPPAGHPRFGSRLGVDEVTAQIGAGGMGEVYRATRHEAESRRRASRSCPTSFADDAERLARFQREAKSLAALNHPNIAHIHGLEKSDGHDARSSWSWSRATTLADRIAQRRDCRSTKRCRSRNRSPRRSKPRTSRASSIAI